MKVNPDNRKWRPVWLLFALALVWLASACTARAEKNVSVFSSGKTLQAIFQGVAESAGVDIYLDPEVKGTVDLSLKDFPFTSAMNAICSAANLEWEKGNSSSDKEVYLVHRKAKTVALDPEAAADEAPTNTRLDFRTAAERVADEAKEAASKDAGAVADGAQATAEKPKNVRELHLNAAQLRMVLGGVPSMKANSVLNQWRRQSSMNGPRMYGPGVNGYISGPGYGAYPYYYDARGNRYGYNPDGSVWIIRPAKQHHVIKTKHRSSAKR